MAGSTKSFWSVRRFGNGDLGMEIWGLEVGEAGLSLSTNAQSPGSREHSYHYFLSTYGEYP